MIDKESLSYGCSSIYEFDRIDFDEVDYVRGILGEKLKREPRLFYPKKTPKKQLKKLNMENCI